MKKTMVAIDSGKTKKYIEASGMNMSEIASKLGLSHDVIAAAVRNGRLAEDNLSPLCGILDITEGAILTRPEASASKEDNEKLAQLNFELERLDRDFLSEKEDLATTFEFMKAQIKLMRNDLMTIECGISRLEEYLK